MLLVAKQLYEALMSFFLYFCHHFLKNASFTQDNQGGANRNEGELRGVNGSQGEVRRVKWSRRDLRRVKRNKEDSSGLILIYSDMFLHTVCFFTPVKKYRPFHTGIWCCQIFNYTQNFSYTENLLH